MPLTVSEANEAFRRVVKIYPTTIQMQTFRDKHEAYTELGQYPRAPAFYSDGTIYVMLDDNDYYQAVMLIAHEINHQYSDPGSIITGYLVARLFVKAEALDFDFVKNGMEMVNVYSDIVVNNVFWNDKNFIDEFGLDKIDEAFEKFYHVNDSIGHLSSGDFANFQGGGYQFVQLGMALGYLKIHDKPRYQGLMATIPGEMKDILSRVEFLINERNYAIRELQKYYVHAVDILKAMKRMGLRV